MGPDGAPMQSAKMNPFIKTFECTYYYAVATGERKK